MVGRSDTRGGSQSHAFLWMRGVLRDLNDLLPKDSGWVLTEACAINDAGQIAGTGLFRGRHRGFLLTPRPPDRTRDGPPGRGGR